MDIYNRLERVRIQKTKKITYKSIKELKFKKI